MTPRQKKYQHLHVQLAYLKLALWIIDFPELVENEARAETVKPLRDVAPNGKSGSEEDE